MQHVSTKRIYLHGLGASLVNLCAVSCYSLLVIRLSLDYLSKPEFGLLSLITQVSASISIIDLGLSIAFYRILIDYTSVTRERYANALCTASRVFNLLGVIALMAAALVAFAGSTHLSVPPALHGSFVILMLGQGCHIFISFALKPLTAPLAAVGKHYYIYWLGSALAVINSLLFWGSLEWGFGIYSALIAHSVALLLNIVLVWKLAKPYIREKSQGRFDSAIFREVVKFARDSMLWQIGGQVLNSLPILLASAWFALGATADVSGGLKLILLMVSLCTRFGDMSVTPLSIQFSKGDEEGAASHMLRIARVTGGISAWAALAIICINPAFIQWWMLGKITWSWHENTTGAAWVAVLSVAQCLYSYTVICRLLSIIRWAMLLECLIYVAVAYALSPWAGVASLLWAKPSATLIIMLIVALRLRKTTRLETRQIIPIILRQALAFALLIPPCLWAGRWISSNIHDPFQALLASGALALAALAIATPILFGREVRTDLLGMLNRLLKKLRSNDAISAA